MLANQLPGWLIAAIRAAYILSELSQRNATCAVLCGLGLTQTTGPAGTNGTQSCKVPRVSGTWPSVWSFGVMT